MVEIPTGYFVAITGASAIFGLFVGISLVNFFGRKSKESSLEEDKRQEIYGVIQDLDRVIEYANKLYHDPENVRIGNVLSIPLAGTADRATRRGKLYELRSHLSSYLKSGRLPYDVEDELNIVRTLRSNVDKGMKKLAPYALSGGMFTKEEKSRVDHFSDEALSALDKVERILTKKKS